MVDCDVPEEEYLEPGKLKTFTQLLKNKELAPFIEQFIIKPVGAPVLAPEDDTRDTYNPADEFQDDLDINSI